MTTTAHLRPPIATRRGLLRRWLETAGVVGEHRQPHVEARTRTDDGVDLAGTFLPGPGPDAPAVLLVHGFAAHRRKPAYAYLADVMSAHAHVLALDLRGHGASGGVSTLGDREALDVAAGVRWLEAYGLPFVVGIGMSMGGTAMIHAAATGVALDAVVAISTPAHLHEVPRTVPMQRLSTVWRSPWRRRALRAFVGVRLIAPQRWSPPPHPAKAARSVSVPTLVIHGRDDAYFPPEDGRAIAAAVPAGATLWEQPAGFGHAEDGVTPGFARDLAMAVVTVARTGRFPDRADGSRPGRVVA